MKDAFISVLQDYLSKENTDYALMINGEWGSGKTYFIDNEVKHVIESFLVPNQKNKKGQDVKKYKCVTVSLYGVSSRQDITDAIFFSLKPELKWIRAISNRVISATEVIPKVGEAIKNIISLNNKEKDDLKKLLCSFNDKVIIFDDLERTDKSLDIQSVLGYINHLAERERYKIIVVSNDDVLSSDYKGFKEKTIRFTYNHQPNLVEILDSIIEDQKDPDYKSFLSENKTDLILIFNSGQCKNIRTLMFVIDLFHKIFERVSGDYSDSIRKDLLVPFTIISIEAKKGHPKDELEISLPSIQSFSSFSKKTKIDLSTASVSEQTSPKVIDEAAQKREEYQKCLKSQYGALGGRINLEAQLFNWVFDGYVSEEVFNTVIEVIRGEYKKKEVSPEAHLVQIISRWDQIQDDDFASIIEDIKKSLCVGKFKIFDILRIYASFLQIDSMQIDGFNITTTDISIFKNAIEQAMGDLPYIHHFNMHAPTWDVNDTSEAKDKYNELLSFANSINNQHRDESQKEQQNNVLSMIKNNDIENFKQFISDYNNKSILEGISPIELVDAIVVASAEIREWFYIGISEFYPENLSNPSPDYLEGLERIKKPLDSYIENLTSRKVSTISLINLQSKINRTIVNYRKRLGMA